MDKEVLSGRRIVDIQHFLKQILKGERHEPFDCSIIDMQVMRENKSGLYSELVLKCRMCLCVKTITTNENVKNLDVNSSVVLGCISTGIGYSQMNELSASLNMPLMSHNTFNNYHEKVAHVIRNANITLMHEAAVEEANLAIEEKEVDKDGCPCITVVTDGAWGKRSYNVNYDSMSGVVNIQ